MNRRSMLKLLGGGVAAFATHPLWAGAPTQPDDFFIIVHAGGGWDVTLWADPRNDTKGIVMPAAATNTDTSKLARWKATANQSFEILAPQDVAFQLGPAIGDLYDLRTRLTIFNGIAMNTVSHEDGVVYSLTGRHKTGGTVPGSSVDVMLANELGKSQLMPAVAIQFGSHFVGTTLESHAIPLRVGSVEEISKSFARSDTYLDATDRTAISALLTEEATELAASSTHVEPYRRLAEQETALPKLVGGDLGATFDVRRLQSKYPQFDYRGVQGTAAVGAAFAVEAIRQNLVRCIGFSLGGLDTHAANYRMHAYTLQTLFGTIAQMVKLLDDAPHPTRANTKLSERTHVLVVSDFCRTPQINLSGGRDHYPNNSALVISPRFRGGITHGGTDAEQLLPTDIAFGATRRPISPADVIATFLGAFSIDPRRYMRDGEVIAGAIV